MSTSTISETARALSPEPDAPPVALGWRELRAALRHAAIALAAWLALAVAATPLLPLSDTVIAVGSPQRMLRALPEGTVGTLGAGSVSLSLAIEHPRQVRALYGAGAWIVLPASRGACIELARSAPPQLRPAM